MQILTSETIRDSVRQRLFQHYFIDVDGCWISTYKCKESGGHPSIKLSTGKNVQVHRVSYELYVGPLGDSPHIHVLHKCDKPDCFKPQCLYQGTERDNHRDSRERGRMLMGETAGRAKLSNSQAEEIRSLRRLKGIRTELLCMMFEVSPATIRRVLAHTTYRG